MQDHTGFFFKKTSEDAKDEDVLCDGRVVRMFSNMIRKSFKDKEFMAGKPVSSYIFFRIYGSVGCLFF